MPDPQAWNPADLFMWLLNDGLMATSRPISGQMTSRSMEGGGVTRRYRPGFST